MRIIFTKTHPKYGDFTDAIDAPEGATPEQIEAMQQQRLDNWVEHLENPPPPVEDAPAIDAEG